MLIRPVTVTVDALSRMMHAYRLGDPPAVIRGAPVWLEPDDAHAADDSMWAEFRAAGLVEGPGRLSADALDVLHVLARPSVEYFATFTHRGKEFAAWVAGGSGDAVLAYRDGTDVRITELRDVSLPETLMGQLPDVPPARVDSVNVRYEQLAAANGQDWLDWTDTASNAAKDARTLLRLGRQRRIGQGELYVGTLDRLGRRRITRNPIRYHDIASGRILITLVAGYVSVAPATKALLVTNLNRAHRELVGQPED